VENDPTNATFIALFYRDVVPEEGTSTRRSVVMALLVGSGVALSAIAIVFSIIAIPLLALASLSGGGSGLDQPFVRNGLLHVAIPVGVGLGVLTGVAVARWYRRGGHLPVD
jgi:hypothetical protein